MVLIGAALLCVGGTVGYFWGSNQANTLVVKSVRYAGNYHFVNPPLYTEVPQNLSFPEYSSLKDKISSAIQQAVSAQKASDVGVYFRDLNEGHWVGINEKDTFAPGSLMKVATLITVLRLTGNNEERLQTPLHLIFGDSYNPEPQDYFPPQDPVRPGGTYTIESLLNHLIIQSDNRAADALDYYFEITELDRTFNDLQVPIPESATSESNTPQDYSHFFRVLYNGSYLSAQASERALTLLSHSNFTDGLVAGTPSGTVVSHKFGERFLNNTNELHDCGIVYFPNHPYFLCVMTKGADFATLATVIKNISAITWAEVSNRYK